MAGGHKRVTFTENVFVPMASNDNLPALRANTRPSVDTAPSDLVNQEVGTNTVDSRAPRRGLPGAAPGCCLFVGSLFVYSLFCTSRLLAPARDSNCERAMLFCMCRGACGRRYSTEASVTSLTFSK